MKKLLLLCAIYLCTIPAFSQKGHNQLGIGADVAFPTGDLADGVKTGFGGYVKGLLGVGTNGQLTFTTGYTSFGWNDDEIGIDVDGSFSVIPLLLGYRQNFSGFYVEPQLGLGIYNSKIKFMDESESDSESAFTWAIGLGYVINQAFDIGFRYQSAIKDSEELNHFGLRLGYNFNLGGAK